jgi:hypothetical protein
MGETKIKDIPSYFNNYIVLKVKPEVRFELTMINSAG